MFNTTRAVPHGRVRIGGVAAPADRASPTTSTSAEASPPPMTSTTSYSAVDMGRDAASSLYNWLLSLCCSVACTTTTVAVNHRVVRVVRLLAEGGFSFVYLVENGSEKFALKKVLSQTPEQSDAARWEIKVHSSIDHPNCMPLIDHCVATTPAGAEEFRLLMPLYPHGTLLDKCVKHMQAGTRIPERTALQIFQVQSPLMASDGLSECP